MNRTDLEADVSRRTKVAPKVVAQVLAAAFESMADTLKRGERVSQTGFGSFEVVETPRRQGRGVKVDAAGNRLSRRSVAFKAGKGLETAMNGMADA